VPKLIYKLNHEVGVPSDRLEWHGHNDFHKVHVNAATAWLYGCDAVNATLFGFGERTGNPPLEGAIIEYIALKGKLHGIHPQAITELADYMRSIGLPIPDHYPLVGRCFNTTSAGIHAGGLRRDERIYNIFDTTHLLNRPPRVALTDKSGADGVAHWVNECFGLKGDHRISVIRCTSWPAGSTTSTRSTGGSRRSATRRWRPRCRRSCLSTGESTKGSRSFQTPPERGAS